MQKYIDLDLEEYICSKDLGGFMSKDTLNKYAGKLVKRMQQEVKLMAEVSKQNINQFINKILCCVERRK